MEQGAKMVEQTWRLGGAQNELSVEKKNDRMNIDNCRMRFKIKYVRDYLPHYTHTYVLGIVAYVLNG